jgi:hypothetical protein
MYRSFTSLDKLIPKYYNFVAIINGIVFLIYFYMLNLYTV